MNAKPTEVGCGSIPSISMKMKADFWLRLRASLWTASIAGIVATSFVLWSSHGFKYLDATSFALEVLVPAAGAGISGYLFGWHLLDPQQCHDAILSLLYGVVTGLIAYCVSIGIFALMTFPLAIIQRYQEGMRWELSLAVPELVLVYIAAVPLAILFTGWFTLPVAAIAGYLLSRFCR